MTDREVVRPWTAADAVIGIREDAGNQGSWSILLGMPDGTLSLETRLSYREARGIVKEQWRRMTSEVNEGLRFGTRRRGDKWVMSERCPDGIVRTFTASHDSKRSAPREAFAPNLRFEVFQRDGFRCRYCGDGPDETVLHVDHIHPVSAGGTNDMDNLVTACQPCNLGKRAKVGVELP